MDALSLIGLKPHLSRNEWPVFTSTVSAGFPSPADDYIENHIDLNEYLVQHKAATFFLRVQGDSMTGLGILNNDLLVVDRSLPVRDGNIVIATVDGEFTVKQLVYSPKGSVLRAANCSSMMLLSTPRTIWKYGGLFVGRFTSYGRSKPKHCVD